MNFDSKGASRGASRPITRDHYIAAVDGLRAVAIVPVVCFHVGLPGFTGGFVGVDIFFVISGFLITRLLHQEACRSGTIDILGFYARRVRRLLPALLVVLSATLVAGAIFLTVVGEQQDLNRSAVATTAFASNIYFWRTQTGYFAGPSDQLPLLHMWTLAVEEQFYIVWPLAMLAAVAVVRRFKLSLDNTLVGLLLAGSVVSLVGCLLITPIRPTAAFYLTPFRAWEFGIGGLIALMPSLSGRFLRIAQVLSLAGAAAIAASVYYFNSETKFPGIAALLPTLGAAAIIFAAPLPCAVSQALSLRPLVTIGRWSYSWYLWHWPMLAIVRSIDLGERGTLRDLTIAIVALIFSAATYRWVEEPIRRQRPWPFSRDSKTVFAGATILVSLALLAGAFQVLSNIRAQADPLTSAALQAKREVFPYPSACSHFKLPFTGLAPAVDCTINTASAGPTVLLWGDSHAAHFIPAMAQWATQHNTRLLPRVMGACPPVDIQPNNAPDIAVKSCIEFNAAVTETLPQLRAGGSTIVVLAARWFITELWKPNEQQAHDALWRTVSAIRHNNLNVVIFADVPSRTYSVPECVARRGPAACSRTRADVEHDRGPALNVLHQIVAEFPGTILWDPINEVCGATECPAVNQSGVVLYRDAHHLSVGGSKSLSAVLGSALGRAIE